MDWSFFTDTLISLVTLTFLEIILGVDNLIFIFIISNRLPPNKQKAGRRIGLSLALITRLILLVSVLWLIKLTQPLFSIMNFSFSIRDFFSDWRWNIFTLQKYHRNPH